MEKSKVMVDARRCSACQFSGSMLGAGKTFQLVCRFNPPTATGALVQTQEGVQWQGTSLWPSVSETDFCSKFSARLN